MNDYNMAIEVINDLIAGLSPSYQEKIHSNMRQLEKPINEYHLNYGAAYTKQLETLSDLIINNETGKKRFAVFNMEAGLGKSRHTNEVIRRYFNAPSENRQGHRKLLIVKAFKRDVEQCVNDLNQGGLQGRVLGITSDNWTEWRNQTHRFERFDVLTITHQRYMDLCLYSYQRKMVSKGRHTLILDESINFPMYSFDERKYKHVQHIIQTWHLDDEYIEICRPLINMITDLKSRNGSNNHCFVCLPRIDMTKLAQFKNRIQVNSASLTDYNAVLDFIECLALLYANECIYNNGTLSTVNPRHRLWGLKNNIILDAAGAINPLYHIGRNVRIVSQQNIINHEHSTMHWIKSNSSRTFINRCPDYLAEISKLIIQSYMPGRKTLLIIQKCFVEKLQEALASEGITDVAFGNEYTDQSVVIEHFGNLIGSNKYLDFSQCWILGMPNRRMESYLLNWKQYTNRPLKGNKLSISSGRRWGFRNPEFEKVRVGALINELYQCVRRVQRIAKPKADIFIITKSEEIINGVASQLLNIKQSEPVQLMLRTSNRELTLYEKMRNLILELEPGTYAKRDLRASIGVSTNHFSDVCKHELIRGLINTGMISFPTNNNRIMIKH